jgi:hypothetical protein
MPVQAQNTVPPCAKEPHAAIINTARLHVNQYLQSQTPENAEHVLTDGKQLEQTLRTLPGSGSNLHSGMNINPELHLVDEQPDHRIVHHFIL